MPIVRMPLFQFHMLAAPSVSLGHGLAIERFEFSDAYRIPLFSEQDVRHMRQAKWALVFEGGESDGFRAKSNTALLAFRVFSQQHPPFIKYRLADVAERSTRISQPMTYNYAAERENKPYSAEDLDVVRRGFDHMQEMDGVSTRTHNALYFLYRAFHSDKWIDSFLLMTSALESLFSKDAPGGATTAISTRAASLLRSVERCTKDEIEQLYDLRSDMTHGRVVASDDPDENLGRLEHLEYVTTAAFRKLLESRGYLRFRTKADRDAFMGSLNVAL